MPQQVCWWNATLILNHDRLLQSYQNGRRYSFEDWAPEEQLTSQITVSDLLHLVALPDDRGRYQLEDGRDITAFREGVEELVGVSIAYLGGPLYLETPEEQRKRRASCVVMREAVPVMEHESERGGKE